MEVTMEFRKVATRVAEGIQSCEMHKKNIFHIVSERPSRYEETEYQKSPKANFLLQYIREKHLYLKENNQFLFRNSNKVFIRGKKLSISLSTIFLLQSLRLLQHLEKPIELSLGLFANLGRPILLTVSLIKIIYIYTYMKNDNWKKNKLS